jgi:CheY-like chemotaxis protein
VFEKEGVMDIHCSVIVAGWDPEWAGHFTEKLGNVFPKLRGSIYTVHHNSVARSPRSPVLTEILDLVLAGEMRWQCIFLNTDFGFESCVKAVDRIRSYQAHRHVPIIVLHGSSDQERESARQADIQLLIDSQDINENELRPYLATLLFYYDC